MCEIISVCSLAVQNMPVYLSLFSAEPKPRQVGAQGTLHGPPQRAHTQLHAPTCLLLSLGCSLEDKELHVGMAESQEGS